MYEHAARRTAILLLTIGTLAGDALGPCAARALLGAPPGGREWPTYGHDPHRTGNGKTTLDANSVTTLMQGWSFATGDAVTATPIVVGGTLFVGSWDGNFYALDAVTGQERWRFTIDPQLAIVPQPGNRQPTDVTSDGGVITSSAYYLPGVGTRPDLVIFGGGYTLYALRAGDGSLFWKHAYTGRPELPDDPDHDSTRIFASPAVVGNQVLFSTSADGNAGYRGRVIAADVETGNPNWIRELDVDTNGTILNDGCGGVWTSPAIIERDNVEIIAVADCHFESPPPYNERVLALNIADGTTKWIFFPPRGDDPDCDFDFGATANLGTALDGTPVFLGICAKDGYCYSLDPETGGLRWQTNVVFGGFSGGFIATTAFDGVRVYGATAIGDFGRFEMGTNVLCQPSNPADLPVQEPSQHSFDALTGAVGWQQTASQAFGPTTVAGGMVFLPLGLVPEITIRDAASGRLLTTIPLTANSDSGVVTVGNAIYFGTGSSQQGTPAGVHAYTPLGVAPQMPRSDPYKCYRAVQPAPRFDPRDESFADPFETQTASIRKPEMTCNPANANGEGLADASAHLSCYRLREPGGFAARTLLVRDRFGDDTLTLVRSQELCLPSEQNQMPSTLNIDRYKCYTVTRPTPRFAHQTVDLRDEFGTKTAAVLKPTTFCTAVDEDGQGVKDAGAHLTCYRIKDQGSGPAPQSVAIHNQFGDESLTLVGARTLCVPSSLL